MFHGLIDEVQIFDRALSEVEIGAIFDAGADGMCGSGGSVAVDDPALPRSFHFSAPWPNPSVRPTHLSFQLPAEAEVRIEVFDVAGRRVATPVRGKRMPAGEQRLVWDGRDDSGRRIESGVFQIRVMAGGSMAVRRVILLP